MQVITHRAFDLIVGITKFSAGEVVTSENMVDSVFQLGSNFQYVWCNYKGSCALVNTQTGERLDRPAGVCTLTEPIPFGEWRMELPEDMEVLCISPLANTNRLPIIGKVELFRLAKGEQQVVQQGTRLFLGAGSLSIDGIVGNNFAGPRQLEFKSGAKLVTAIEDAFGYIIL